MTKLQNEFNINDETLFSIDENLWEVSAGKFYISKDNYKEVITVLEQAGISLINSANHLKIVYERG